MARLERTVLTTYHQVALCFGHPRAVISVMFPVGALQSSGFCSDTLLGQMSLLVFLINLPAGVQIIQMST